MLGGNLGAAVQMLKVMNQQGGQSWDATANAPTNLVLTVLSDTEIDGSFTINGTGQDGHKVYISPDNVTFILLDILAGTDNTFQATGLTANTLYYFHVKAYKGAEESPECDYAQSYTQTYLDAIENDANLVAFYRMDEAAGTEFVDSKSGNDATINGTVTLGTTIDFLADDTSKGATFDGASGYASIGNIAALNFARTDKFTICAIAKPNVLRSGVSLDYWIYGKSNPSAPYNGLVFGIKFNGLTGDAAATDLLVLFGSDWGAQYIYERQNDIDLLNTQTYFVVVTYDGSGAKEGIKLYVNGQLTYNRKVQSGVSGTIAEGQDTTTTTNAEIGRRNTLNKWYKGDMKDLAIFNTDKSYEWVTKQFVLTKKLDFTTPVYTVNSPRPQVLYDCDADSDIDDIVDLLLMLNLEHLGELDIKGIVVSSANDHAASCIYAILNYYGRTSIPIGVNTSALGLSTSKFTAEVTTAYGVTGKIENTDFDNYLTTQRSLLATAEDNSIEYITTGALSSVKGLLESPADGISPLTGLELVTAKVRTLFVVAGKWPFGEGVSDFSVDAARATVSAYVLANWPTSVPIIFCSINDGNTLKTGANTMLSLNADNPARLAWNEYFGTADDSDSREAWAQIAIIPLARGFLGHQVKGPAYAAIVGYKGTAAVNTTTLKTSWDETTDSNHNFMGKVMADAYYIAEINSLLKDVTEW